MAIGKEDVWRAADAIEVRSGKPTLDAVRAELGGGSFSTIAPAMAEWRARKAARLSPDYEPMPSSLSDRLGELGEQIWSNAVDAASVLLRAERDAIRRERSEIESERLEIGKWADHLTEALDRARKENETLEDSIAASRNEIGSLGQELAAAHARLADGDVRYADLQRQLEEAREATAIAREQAAALRGQVEATEMQNAAMLAKLSPGSGQSRRT